MTRASVTSAVSFEFASRSDVGKVRSGNEDTVLVDEDLGLLVVCDGVGGQAAGEVASQQAARELQRFVGAHGRSRWPSADDAGKVLGNALRAANERVVTLASQKRELDGMGATCVALLVAEDGVAVAHAGDSRCYRLDSSGAVRLTNDHTTDEIARRFYVEEGGGDLTEPRKSSGILVQALGRDPSTFRATISAHPIVAGSTFLLCSDGLTDELTDDAIAGIVSRGGPLHDTCDALIRQANENGGRDNVSVALLHVTAVNDLKRLGASFWFAVEIVLWILSAFMAGVVAWDLWKFRG